MELRDANLQVYEKNSFPYPLSCILPSFSENASRLLLPKRLSKCANKISFRKYKQKVALLVTYLFNYDSSKSTSFMLNVAFELLLVVLSTVFIKRLQKHFFSQPVCFEMYFLIKS